MSWEDYITREEFDRWADLSARSTVWCNWHTNPEWMIENHYQVVTMLTVAEALEWSELSEKVGSIPI
jgi:hypothetical protein